MPQAVAFEPEIVARMRDVLRRLYAPETLSPDERRDLANRLDALLSQGVEIDV